MLKKRIIVLDDEPMVLSLVKEIIEEDEELEVTAMAKDKEEFLNLLRNHYFDAAFIDISIGGSEGGLDILRILKSQDIALPCIVLSAHEEIDYALKCLQAGAKGYINKRHIFTNLTQALKEILCGNLFVSGVYGKYIINRYSRYEQTAAALGDTRLSP